MQHLHDITKARVSINLLLCQQAACLPQHSVVMSLMRRFLNVIVTVTLLTAASLAV